MYFDRKSIDIELENCEHPFTATRNLPDLDITPPSIELSGNIGTNLPLRTKRVCIQSPTESSVRIITPRCESSHWPPPCRSDFYPLGLSPEYPSTPVSPEDARLIPPNLETSDSCCCGRNGLCAALFCCTGIRQEDDLPPPRSLSFWQRLVQCFRRVESTNDDMELADQSRLSIRPLDDGPSPCLPAGQEEALLRPDLEQVPPERVPNSELVQPVRSRRRWLNSLRGSLRQDRRSQESSRILTMTPQREDLATSTPPRPTSLRFRNLESEAGASSASEPVAMDAVPVGISSTDQTSKGFKDTPYYAYLDGDSSTPPSSPTRTLISISSREA